MQQKSYTNVTISQLRSSCNAKTKNKDGFFVYWSIAPALLRREPLKDKPQADAGAGDAERLEYILRKCIKYEYILQITHKDTN